MRWNKIKAVLAGAVFAASVMLTGVGAQAATVDDGKEISYVGDTFTAYNVSGLKINNKKTSKVKKGVKTVKTGQNAQSNTYRTKSYFRTTNAYATVTAYEAENGPQAEKYYPATANYQLTFKKAGSYTISYVTYEKESYYIDDYYDSATDKYVDIITKKNFSTDSEDTITTVTYVSPGEQAVEGFYQGANGTKYAYGEEYCYVPVTLAKGADGKTHVKYSAQKLEKITHTKTYKVLKTNSIVKSVKLGKSTNKRSVTYTEGKTSSSVKKAKFLSGNSGKLTVTMGDKNYGLTSILVRTYDASGNPVYTKVSNKKTVAYGQNLYRSESAPEATYKYYSSSMYKPTDVMVFYSNKFTGASTTVNSVSKDAQGNDTYVITQTYTSTNPSTGKEVILTEKYNITKKKPYADLDYFKYEYTRSYQSWNSSTNKYEEKTSTGSENSLESFFDNYAVTNFYKK